MKKLICILLIISAFSVQSQIRIGGEIAIDINVPIPDIVITTRKRRPAPPQKQQPIIHVCSTRCNHSFGQINNQNGPRGQYVFEVTDASIVPLNDYEEKVLFVLDTGEVLEVIIATENPNDVNYNYYEHCECRGSNKILAVFLNNQEIPLRNGSLSLQQHHNGALQGVVNLHTQYEGDFNGNVNF